MFLSWSPRWLSLKADTKFNIIPIAFLLGLNPPAVNFANAGNNCTDANQGLLGSCPQIE